jgi:GxxExxY protein
MGASMAASFALSAHLEDLATVLVDSAFKVHQALGPGLLESVYESCFCIELTNRRISYERQAQMSLVYEGVNVDGGFRLDLLVEKSIVVEIKAVEKLLPIHQSQVLTYLKLTNLRLGLLVNFNVQMFKQGVRRVVL